MRKRLSACLGVLLLLAGTTPGQDTVPGVPGGPGSGGTTLPPGAGGEHTIDYDVLERTQRMLAMQIAAESARQGTQDSIRRLLTSMARRIGRGFTTLRFRQAAEAGPTLHDPEVTLGASWGETEMSRDGDCTRGDTSEGNVSLNADVGKAGQAGVTLSSARTHYRGRLGSETTADSADAYVNMDVSQHLAGGLFTTFSQLDMERVPHGTGPTYGGGATLSSWYGIGSVDITLTGALVKTYQEAGEKEHDTSATALLDVQKSWSDMLSTSVYGFFSDSLRTSDDVAGDRTFGSLGFDMVVTPSDRVSFSVGCERTIALAGYNDYRINTGVTVSW